MAQQEWKPSEMRQLAADLRHLIQSIRGYDCSRIEWLAGALDLQATEMEASQAGRLQHSQSRHNAHPHLGDR